MDLFELNGHSYLIVEDYYSRWTETIHLKQTTSVAVMERCISIFAKFGIPEVVLSDTDPQFSSRESWNSPKTIVSLILQIVPIILKETVKQKGLFRQWKISWTSPLTLTLPFSTTVQLHFYMATVRQNWWWAENSETVCLQSRVNIFPSNQKSKDEHFRNQQKYYHDLWHRAKEVT